MARTKTLSQNIVLLAGATGSIAYGVTGSTPYPLWGVKSLDYGWTYPKEDLLHYGYAAAQERLSLESPEVTLDCSYYITDATNEAFIGLDAGGAESCLTQILNGTTAEKEYFVFVAPEGSDAWGLNGASSGISVLGIGNGFLNSYSIEASVGDFPTASFQIQGLNIRTYTGGLNQQSPTVDPATGFEVTGYKFTIGEIDPDAVGATLEDTKAIRPGDIHLTLSQAGGLFHSYTNTDVQSFRLGFDLNRTSIQKLGSRFAATRTIQFPVNVNFEVTMLAKELATGSLANFLCTTGLYRADLIMYFPSCSGFGTGVDGWGAFGASMRNISLEGQSWATSPGGEPETVTTTWVGTIGSSTDTSNGLFLSGYAST